MQQRPFAIIVNPRSGVGQAGKLASYLANSLSPDQYELFQTTHAGHAVHLAKELAEQNKFTIVAAGGDGTIHEIASVLVDTGQPMGIIPLGSGNGLARHLGIPISISKAIQYLSTSKPQSIDIIRCNGKVCCNTTGIGFDARVAQHFGKDGRRGLLSYIKTSFAQYLDSPEFYVQINNKEYTKVWSVVFANSNQMGNNAVIAPKASVQDGIIDLVIVRKPKWWQIPALFYYVFSGNIDQCSLVTHESGTDFKVMLNENIELQVDGEYLGTTLQLEIDIHPGMLKVLC